MICTPAIYSPYSIQIALLVRRHCTVVGMEILQIIHLKIKLSTTVLPLGHFTDPHPLYCRWFAEKACVSLNKNPHYYYYYHKAMMVGKLTRRYLEQESSRLETYADIRGGCS
jgi:hypothetical protein